MRTVREPAVAGSFYPADARELAATIDAHLDEAARRCPVRDEESPERLRALLAPHAGYVYSGATAAAGYLRVAALRDRTGGIGSTQRIERVVLAGPVHRVYVDGLAHPACEVFRTPLGDVPVEPVSETLRAALPQIVDSPAAHTQEHSLEVHVPFLQRVLGEFTLLPLAVGGVAAQDVADVLAAVTGAGRGWDERTLLVISTDLSHYLPDAQARQVDSRTIGQILDLDATIPTDRACGAHPTNGLLALAARQSLVPRFVEASTSADTAGDRRRVVGYASVTFESPTPAPTQES